MILHRYIARRFLTVWLYITFGFLALVFFVNLADHIRILAGENVPFLDLVSLTMLVVPERFYQILPLVFLITSVVLHTSMARSQELIIYRTSGRSGWHILIAPSLITILIGVLFVAIFNPIVANSSKVHHERMDDITAEQLTLARATKNKLWLRQGGDGESFIIYSGRSNFNGARLLDVSFHGFSNDGTPTRRIEAKIARIKDGQWLLTNGKIWNFISSFTPEKDAETFATMQIPSTLDVDQIKNSFGEPALVSIWSLPSFIMQMDQAGFSAVRHRVWLQMELAMPFFLVALVLIGAGLTMRYNRAQNTIILAMTALIAGSAFYFVRNFAYILSTNGQLPYYLYVWLPVLAGLALAFAIIFHTEDG